MSTASSACITVAKGGVGESGASSFVVHTVGGNASKIIILRTVATSLCPNTGAVAVLVVDGVPSASGAISVQGSSVQTEATPGAKIAAIVHTVPLFNNVVCVRLGELSYILDECELVQAEGTVKALATTTAVASPPSTRDWFAWNNLMPPKPDDFHVVAEVQVANPGVDVFLFPRVPQGFNQRILLLDMVLVPQSGIWPQVVVWKPVRYDKVNATYDEVHIYYSGSLIEQLRVQTVQ